MTAGRPRTARPRSSTTPRSVAHSFNPSATAVHRVALLEERGGSLEHVLGLEDADGRLELGGEARVMVQVRGLIDEALRLANRERPALRDLVRDGLGLDDGLACRHHPRDEPGG